MKFANYLIATMIACPIFQSANLEALWGFSSNSPSHTSHGFNQTKRDLEISIEIETRRLKSTEENIATLIAYILELAETRHEEFFEAFTLALAQPENYSLKSFEAILKLLAEQINMNNAEILKELSIREATINKLIFLNKALEEYQKEQGNVDDEQQKEISEQPETEE